MREREMSFSLDRPMRWASSFGSARSSAIIVLLLTGSLGALSGCEQSSVEAGPQESISAENEDEWVITFEDEFDVLDMSKYNTEFIWPREQIINNELQYYIDPELHGYSPFSVQGGILRITADRTPENLKQYTSQPYTSGLLTSRHLGPSQKHGRFEVRAKMPKGQGLWPAFWLLPTFDQWPQGVSILPEIDVVEYLGHEDSWYHTTRHTNVSGQSEGDGAAIDTGVSLHQDFHVYGVEWDENSIRWLFDGIEVFQSDSPADYDKPVHFLLNLAVGGNWAGAPNGATQFPAHFEIDYVRIYKRCDGSGADSSEETEPTDSPSPAVPNVPSNLRGEVYSSSAIELFWDRGADDSYEVFRDGSYLGETTGVSYFESNLEGDTDYLYEVIRRDSAGNRSAPAEVTVTTR